MVLMRPSHLVNCLTNSTAFAQVSPRRSQESPAAVRQKVLKMFQKSIWCRPASSSASNLRRWFSSVVYRWSSMMSPFSIRLRPLVPIKSSPTVTWAPAMPCSSIFPWQPSWAGFALIWPSIIAVAVAAGKILNWTPFTSTTIIIPNLTVKSIPALPTSS